MALTYQQQRDFLRLNPIERQLIDKIESRMPPVVPYKTYAASLEPVRPTSTTTRSTGPSASLLAKREAALAPKYTSASTPSSPPGTSGASGLYTIYQSQQDNLQSGYDARERALRDAWNANRSKINSYYRQMIEATKREREGMKETFRGQRSDAAYQADTGVRRLKEELAALGQADSGLSLGAQAEIQSGYNQRLGQIDRGEAAYNADVDARIQAYRQGRADALAQVDADYSAGIAGATEDYVGDLNEIQSRYYQSMLANRGGGSKETDTSEYLTAAYNTVFNNPEFNNPLQAYMSYAGEFASVLSPSQLGWLKDQVNFWIDNDSDMAILSKLGKKKAG